jgi:1,4-dihydroxy-2-naphthoate octaprenyltransferase
MKTSQIGIQQNIMTKNNTDAIDHDDKQNRKTKHIYAIGYENVVYICNNRY